MKNLALLLTALRWDVVIFLMFVLWLVFVSSANGQVQIQGVKTE